MQDARVFAPNGHVSDEPEHAFLRIDDDEDAALRLSRVADLADQEIEFFAALLFQPVSTDPVDLRVSWLVVGEFAPDLDDSESGLLRAFDLVTQFHALRPGEREARQAQREWRTKLVDGETSRRKQTGLFLVELERDHTALSFRCCCQKTIEELRAVGLRSVNAAHHHQVFAVLFVGNESGNIGDGKAILPRR